jgi:hypothetical protein
MRRREGHASASIREALAEITLHRTTDLSCLNSAMACIKSFSLETGKSCWKVFIERDHWSRTHMDSEGRKEADRSQSRRLDLK